MMVLPSQYHNIETRSNSLCSLVTIDNTNHAHLCGGDAMHHGLVGHMICDMIGHVTTTPSICAGATEPPRYTRTTFGFSRGHEHISYYIHTYIMVHMVVYDECGTSILSNGRSKGVLSVGNMNFGGSGTSNRTQPPGSTRVTPNNASSIYRP